uniref:FAD-binding PCMH-type domain-containing protein n=1 Tax=Pseudo-nitzschia australis TaxID=44445 RepID=A0A7S4EIE8_9STRA
MSAENEKIDKRVEDLLFRLSVAMGSSSKNNNNNSNNNNDNNKEEFDYTMGNNKNDLDVNGTNGIIITETVNNETATTSRSRSSTTGAKTVVMGPGVRTEEFMKNVLDANGYSGIVASAAGVAMGGYVSGGGYGLQSRMYGLAIDNVVSLQVVLASGEIKKVRDGDDLFWALRGGGGGNIGVVTSIEYRVYPSRDIKLAATVKVSLAEMTQFLQRLGEKEPDLAPEFTLNVHVYSSRVSDSNDTIQIPNLSPHMANAYMYSEQTSGTTKDPNNVNEEDNRLVTLSMFWMGDTNPDDPVGMEYIKKEIMPLFSSNNSNNTDGDDVIYYYFSWSGMSREREQRPEFKSVWSAQSWNGFLLPGNNTEEVWTDIQSSLSAMFRYCKYVSPRVELWGGAISKIPFNATAFPYREAVYNVGIDLLVPAESDAEVASDEMHLVNAVWPSIARHLDGVYVNYPMASLSSESYPTAYWGNNLDRLVALKEQYDPSHAFQTAQSIPIPGNDS